MIFNTKFYTVAVLATISATTLVSANHDHQDWAFDNGVYDKPAVPSHYKHQPKHQSYGKNDEDCDENEKKQQGSTTPYMPQQQVVYQRPSPPPPVQYKPVYHHYRKYDNDNDDSNTTKNNTKSGSKNNTKKYKTPEDSKQADASTSGSNQISNSILVITMALGFSILTLF